MSHLDPIIDAERHLAAQVAVTPSDWQAAEERMFLDADALSDWLAGECAGSAPFAYGHTEAQCAIACDYVLAGGLSVAELLGLAMVTPFHGVRSACLDRLKARYIGASADRIAQMAAEAADARVADEREAV